MSSMIVPAGVLARLVGGPVCVVVTVRKMERPARRLRKLCTHLAGGPCAESEAVAEPSFTIE